MLFNIKWNHITSALQGSVAQAQEDPEDLEWQMLHLY